MRMCTSVVKKNKKHERATSFFFRIIPVTEEGPPPPRPQSTIRLKNQSHQCFYKEGLWEIE